MGTLYCPPDIWNSFAAPFTTSSIARKAKFHVMNSTMGRRPAIAAPTPSPANPSSAIGASRTRHSPNWSSSPLVTL